MSETLNNTVTTVDNKRQQVIRVSSDEELTSTIQFQNAYNAASRFMNVVSDMIVRELPLRPFQHAPADRL